MSGNPQWTILDSGTLVYGPEGEFNAYSDILGVAMGLHADSGDAYDALVQCVREAALYRQARELAVVEVARRLANLPVDLTEYGAGLRDAYREVLVEVLRQEPPASEDETAHG